MKLQKIQTIDVLKKLNYASIEPFLMEYKNEEIFFEKIVRIVPGKRLVAKGVFNDKKVVIKLFFGGEAEKHLKTEVSGYLLLEEKKILMPNLLVASELDIKGVYVAIFIELYPVRFVEEFIKTKDEKKTLLWLKKIQQVMVELHKNHIAQIDLHLDNFLIVSDHVYVVDYQSIRMIDAKEQRDNLALFYAQLPLRISFMLPELISDYNQAMACELDQADLMKKLEEYRCQRAQHLMRKTLRNSTKFYADQNATVKFACKRECVTPELLFFLNNPAEYVQTKEVEWIKKGNTCSVMKTKINNLTLVIKRYNTKDLQHFLTHFWRKSRAKRSWQFANALELFDIPTPMPIAYAEEYYKGVRIASYYIAVHCDGMLLNDALARNLDEKIMEKAVNVIHELETLKISHGDMKATNFIVKDNEVLVIDFDAMKMHDDEKTWKEANRKDRLRFRKNWLEIPKIMKVFDHLLKKG